MDRRATARQPFAHDPEVRMTLHLYFARRFAAWLGIIFLALFALVALVDLVDQTRRFAERGASAGGIIELVLLNAPETLSQILPLIVLLATVAFFIGLSRSSELVAARAAGRSGLHALFAPIAVVLIVGTLATTTLRPSISRGRPRGRTTRSWGTSSP